MRKRHRGLYRALLICLALSVSASARADFAQRPAPETSAPQQQLLLDIARSGQRLVAVGEHGLIISSDDEGQSWQQATVPVNVLLTAVSFVDEQYGWAVGHGGTILHSRDGGRTWEVQFDGNRANQQWLDFTRRRVEMLEKVPTPTGHTPVEEVLVTQLEEARYAVDDAELALETGPADPFLDVWFANRQVGIAVGAYGMIYRTEDGGQQWQLAASGIHNPERYHYYSLAADHQGHLYLSGESGLLFHSEDKGKSWEQLDSDYDGSLFGVITTTDATLAFGLRGNVLRSEDNGKTWQSISDGTEASLYGGAVLTNGDIVLVGAGGELLLSQDNGNSFIQGQHESRGTFSAVVSGKGQQLLLVGMPGMRTFDRTQIKP